MTYEDINLIRKERSLYFKEIRNKFDLAENDICDGYFIMANEAEIRKIISFLKDKNFNKKIAIAASDSFTNRRLLETLYFDYLVSPEETRESDKLRQRSSGINHYLAKVARQKNIKILVSIDNIIRKDKKEKARIIARIIQNIKICRKSKTEIKIASFSKNFFLDKKERERIGAAFGMSSQQFSTCSVF